MVRWWVEDELDIHNMQVTMCPCPICHGCQMSHVHWLTVSICLVWDIHLQRRGKWMKMATFALLLFLWCTQFHRWCPWECLNLSASVFKGIHFIKFIEEVPSSIGYRIQPDVNTGIISQNYTTPTHYNMGSHREGVVGTTSMTSSPPPRCETWRHTKTPPTCPSANSLSYGLTCMQRWGVVFFGGEFLERASKQLVFVGCLGNMN